MSRSPAFFRTDGSTLCGFVWLVCVMAATLYPFDFTVDILGPAGRATFGVDPRQLTDVGDNLFNVMLFLPLGALVQAQQLRRRLALAGGTLVLAGFLGLLISSVVEYLQAYLPGRASSVVDIASNTAGALIGAIGYRLAGTLVAWMRSQESLAVLAGIMLAYTMLALVISAFLQLQTRLSNWSDEYPLLVGNERTGDRPWRGRIVAFELTDAATPQGAVRAFSTGGSLVLPGERLAAFDFAGDPPYRDAAGLVPSLEWTGKQESLSGEGVTLKGAAWLRTSGPAPAIAEGVRQSNAFTLLVRCATGEMNQTGPARILSNSSDTGHRNFTLGQTGNAMVFRLRTPHTGPNGDRPELVMPDVFSSHEPRQILVTYDGAVLLATVAGAGHVSRMELSPGSSLVASPLSDVVTSYFNLSAGVVQADVLGAYKLAYIAGLSLFAGGLVGLLRKARSQRRNACLLWALMTAPLLEGTLTLASGRPFDWDNLAVNFVVGILVSLTGVLAISLMVTGVQSVPRGRAQVFG